MQLNTGLMAVLKLLKEKTVIYKQLYSTIFKLYYILDQLNVAFVKWHLTNNPVCVFFGLISW